MIQTMSCLLRPWRTRIFDNESVKSEDSDVASESGKKVACVVDKPTLTRPGRAIQKPLAWLHHVQTGNTSAAIHHYFASLS